VTLATAEHAHHTPATVTIRPSRDADAGADAYTAFFRAEFAAVTRAVYLILHDRDAAEDVAADAFAALLRHWEKVSAYDRPGAWVRRVAIRMAVRAARRDQLRDRLLSWITPPGPIAESSDPDLAAALARLPPRQRAAVMLFYFEDRPLVEVASLLDCAPGTAKAHLFKARQRLASLLGESFEEVADAAG
jgi:RNA polymerase sigma-70 factor (ECF subfamily)